MRKTLLFVVVLLATVGLWAQNNVITYEASAKLDESTKIYSSCLHTDAFNVSISSHTFSNGIGTITFSGTVTSIGSNAFYNCTGLTSITIPNSVTSIGGWVFLGCTGLTSITIPNSVTSIEYSAFYGCSNIKSVQWNAKNCNGCYFDLQLENFFFGDSVQVIPSSICKDMTNLKSIIIPNSVTNIGNDAFNNCTGLTSVIIPKSVTSIGEGAFYGCIGIKSVQWNARNCNGYNFGNQVENFFFGDSVQVIPNNLCKDMTKLTSITIPNSVTSIEYSAFYGCSLISTIKIPENVKSIENKAFSGCTSLPIIDNIRYADTYLVEAVDKTLSSYSIKEGTKWIGTNAFHECRSLNSITIPSSVISIDYGAFGGCTSLMSLAIPSTVTSINGEACWGVLNVVYSGESKDSPWGATYVNKYVEDNLVYENEEKEYLIGCSDSIQGDIIIPNTVNSIGYRAFYDRSSITSISLSSSLTSIGIEAFKFCFSITSIALPASLISIGDNAFYYCRNLKTVYNNSDLTIVKGSTNNGYVAYYANKVYDGIPVDGFVIHKDTILISYIGKDTEVIIPNTIKIIANSAFSNCSTITSITIPEGVKSIGGYAFYNCRSIDSIIIGDAVKKIEEYTFYGCYSLKSITFGKSISSIGDYAFCQCANLDSVNLVESIRTIGEYAFSKCNGLTSVVIGDSIESIGKAAFYYCGKLQSATLGKSVVSIGAGAFEGCVNMTTVNIPNSVTEIGEWAFWECNSLPMEDNVRYADTYVVNAYSSIPVIKEGTKWIGERAFYQNSYLSKITIPESVIQIGTEAFAYASGIVSIEVPSTVTTIRNYAFGNVFHVEYHGQATGAPWGANSHNSYLKDSVVYDSEVPTTLIRCFSKKKGALIIPSTVTSIKVNACVYCSSLTSVVIPPSVMNIGTKAFYGCNKLPVEDNIRYAGTCVVGVTDTSLTTYTIKPGTRFLDTDAFKNCRRIQSIDLPKSLVGIGSSAFSGCSQLRSIEIPDFVKYIGPSAFSYTPLTTVTIPNSIDSIASNAFVEYNITTVNVSIDPFEAENINEIISQMFKGKNISTTVKGVKVSNISPTCATVKVDLTDVETSQYEKMSLDNGDQEHLLNPGVNTILVTGLHPDKENKLGFYSQLPGSTEWRDGNKVSVTTPALKLTTLNPKIPAKCEAIVCAETNMANDETNAGFEWRKCDAPPTLPSKSAKAYVINGSLQGKIKNLSSEYYDVRAYYETEDSTRYYGEWITFDPTEFSYFDPEVHTYYITDELTTNQATLSGFVMAGTDDITKQGFEYWPETANAPSRTAESDVQVVYATGQVMTATIKELNYSTTYHSRAFAITAKTTIYGEEITFTVPEKQRPVYTLTLLAEYGGVVSATPDAPYRENDEITISATPDPGYAFSKWNDGNTQATRTIVLTCDTTFTAEFKVSIPCIVSATATHGTVTGVGTYEYGTQVTLTVVPDAHYHLAQWSDGVTTISRTFTITQDTTFSAECVIDQYVITATGNNGTVTGGGTYTYGDTVTLTATPDPGMLFWSWSDGDTINPRVFVATENANYIAIMVAPSYTVTVLSEDVSKGTVTGGGDFAYHTSITITATPNEGYVFQTWNDGNTDNPRTLVVKDNVTLTASFVAATGLDQLPDSSSDRFTKIIRDGQLYILYDGKIYNALGGLVE